MSIANIIKVNIRRSFFIAFIGVLAACNVEDINDLMSTATTTLSGSVGDGPITQAQIVVTDDSGAVLGQAISDTTANYDVNVPANSIYPLLVTANGGIDMVTGGEPDFTLVSVALNSSVRTVNINPFSTLIVKTAQAMSGGLTANNLSLATQYTFDQLNFGLDSAIFPNPITTTVNEANVAAIIKASEALGEVIRRTQSALLIAGTNLTGDDIIDSIAADMTDGVMDGRGSNANARIAGAANIVSAQVLVELIANRLNVNGSDATSLMDTAINISMPSATINTSDVSITEDVLTQARVSVAAAQTINSNSNLAAVAVILAGLTGNGLAADIQAELPANAYSVFDEVISQVVLADDNQLEAVNASVRSGSTNVIPPETTLPPTPLPEQLPGAFEFSASTYSVGESDQVVNVTIDRVGGSDGVAALEWRTITFNGYGTADFANDYATFLWDERPLTFADGETRKIEQITIHPDSVVEGNETFTVLIRNPTGGASLGSRNSSVVTIIDDDTGSVVDTTAPVITLVGSNPLTLTVGDTYVEAGATATDDVDGDLSSTIVVNNGAVNISTTGSYQVTYNVSDSSGNTANTVIRTVNVIENSGIRPWENLLNEMVGFARAAGTTGGMGGEVCWVNNLNDSGPNSLRECAESVGPKWIRFNVSGVINLASRIWIKSNKTIDGRGVNITLSGQGIRTVAVENIIIHNIIIANQNSAGNALIDINRESKRIWVDHVTFSNSSDDAIQIGTSSTTPGSSPDGITISWCRWEQVGKALIISFNQRFTNDADIDVTVHHNYFNQSRERHPYIRYAKVHSYNNYFYHWNWEASHSTVDGQLASENNIYEPGAYNQAISTTPVASEPVPGLARSRGDWLLGNAVVSERLPASVFNPGSYYSYVADTADADLRAKIVNGAGWQNIPAP